MKKIILAVSLILAFTSCRDVVGPVEGNTPEGPYAVWFNGLSANASVFFEECDSLITNAWSTGSAPNQILGLGSNQFAILSSLSAEIRLYSGENTGTTIGSIPLPEGSNPWSFAVLDGLGYATLLLSDSVAVFDAASYEIISMISTDPNPSGIACSVDKLYVGHSNWPESSSPGGVSVISLDSGELLDWIDTGVNTHWLKLQPSGMLHCYATTYQNDGTITVIDPATPEIIAVIQCGGAPGEGVRSGNCFLSPDGWGNGGLVKYTESGEFSRIALPFAPTNLAISGNTLYATAFGADMVYLLDPATYLILDSLQAGGQGPQGIIAIDPSN